MNAEVEGNKPRMSSLVRSVGANWTGYLVFALSGYIMPRLIGDSLGQRTLGIWDFAWSLVTYTSLLSMGVGSAASRYVARYRASENWLELGRTVSACLAALLISFVLAIGMVAAFVLATPMLLATGVSEAETREAQWLVAILGFNAAIMLPIRLFSGILTGCQRFDLKNLTRCSCHLVGLALMVSLLLSGRGLVWLACVSFSAELCTGLADYVLARRQCPEMHVSVALIKWTKFKEVIAFGAKTLLQGFSNMLTYQTSGLVVAYFLGPAVLAVYARQRALVAFATRLLNQYGHVFVPASSSLQASGDTATLRALAVDAARYGLYIAAPIVAVLALAGGPLVHLWMGSGYEAPVVLAILAIGHLPSLTSRGTYLILVGLNQHGRAGVGTFLCSLVGVGATLMFVGVLGMGIVGAAIAVSLAIVVGEGFLPQFYVCRALRMAARDYVRQIILGPLLAVTPLVATLLAARAIFLDRPIMQLFMGLGIGGALQAIVYWRFVVPPPFKARLIGRLMRRNGDPQVERPEAGSGTCQSSATARDA